MAKKLTIKTRNDPVLFIARHAVDEDRLVYIVVANKPVKYSFGRSKIVYIGTTKVGAGRIASSAAHLAPKVFDVRSETHLYGIRGLDFHVITCQKRQKVKTWLKLERGLLVTFLHEFGEVPLCNKHGKRMAFTDVLDYFTEQRLKGVIYKYS
jgi:hypothetical protein